MPFDPGSWRVFASASARRRFLVHLLIGMLLLVAGLVVFDRYVTVLTDVDALRAVVRGFGVWAPVALIVLQALQVLLAPIPGQVLAAVAGYLFGPWLGTLYNMVGITIGSTAAFWLSRRFGRAYVEGIVDDEVLSTFDAAVERRGPLGLFVLFVIPGLPDDVLCFVGGLTSIPLRKLVLVAILGRAPAFFLVNVFGDLIATGDVRAAVVLFVLLVAVSVLASFRRERIVDALDRWLP